MDTKVRLYLERAENELILARTNFNISVESRLKATLNIPLKNTFFNEVISLCYYSIFYTAKAYLLSKNISTNPPEEHRKTYEEFEKFVESGRLDKELWKIYEEETEKAESLLNILHIEKIKRGRFTYNINASANIPYAKESLENAKKFISIIKNLIEK